MKPVESSLARQLLLHRGLYDGQCVPFFKTLHPHTLSSCLGLSPALAKLAMPSVSQINTMDEAIRTFPSVAQQAAASSPPVGSSPSDAPTAAPLDKIAVGVEALQWLEHVNKRLVASHHKSFTEVNYEFEVGDVVQIGVIAARLPICFASDEWLLQNLGSTTDARLQHPWYLVLVSHHRGLPLDFTRYGSQLTHEKVSVPTSIGLNRNLPMFFKGYDAEKGVYIPKKRPVVVSPTQLQQPQAEEHVHLQQVSVPPASAHAF